MHLRAYVICQVFEIEWFQNPSSVKIHNNVLNIVEISPQFKVMVTHKLVELGVVSMNRNHEAIHIHPLTSNTHKNIWMLHHPFFRHLQRFVKLLLRCTSFPTFSKRDYK